MTIEYRQLEPAADLTLFVHHYWLLKGENHEAHPQAIFPDGSPEIVFNLGDPVVQLGVDVGGLSVQPRAMLVGQMTRALWILPTGRMHMVGVRLAPWGVSAFCDVSASELRDRAIALGDATKALQHLPFNLDGARSLSDELLAQRVDRLLRARLASSDSRRARRLGAIARALHGAPTQSVDAWTRSIGCSSRTLERTFDRYVGLPPKVLMRLRRFQCALRLGTDAPHLTLSAVAARAGYSDQSHLVKEFREFAGAPPSTALAALTDFSSRFLSGDDAE